jgi:electron transfer flavoprotein alpha subunit
MAQQMFAYIIYEDGIADDSAFELAAAAKKIDASADVTAIVAGNGPGLDDVCSKMTAAYKEVWKLDNALLAYPNAEIIRKAIVAIIPQGSIVLAAHEHFGMDLAPGLAVKLGAAYLPDAVDLEGVDGGILKAVRQEYSGQVSTHVTCDVSSGAVITIRPGGFPPEETSLGGQVVDKSGEMGDISAGRKFLEVLQAETGDVDITQSEILVAVGRGIEDEDNLEIINELAESMGGDVACSRPIVDAKWLDKSRQVGTSGLTVKPKVYLALGISGSFQHVGGIKGNPYIVAVNKNAKAPIFQIADVGVVADILEFVPELTEKINEAK